MPIDRVIWKPAALALLIAGVVFITHFKSPIITSFDSRYSIHVAESLIKEFDIDLDEYAFGKNRADYALFFYENHAYSVYPIITSLLAVPFVVVLDKQYTNKKEFYEVCERVTAAAIVAVTAVIIFFTVLLATDSWPASLLLLICFSYSTTAWSIASRGLWSHGPSMMLVSAIVFCLLYARMRDKARLIPAVGVLSAVAYIARPTNAVIVLLVSLYVLVYYRKQFVWFVSAGLVIALLFAGFNKLFYGIVLLPYYVYPLGIHRELLSPWLLKVAVVNPNMWEAFWGNLLSPNRGLFVFSPVFIFCVVGLVMKIRDRTFNPLDMLMAAIAFIHLVIISKTLKDWWGGYSFGPRYFTDILPVLIYLLIPVVVYLFQSKGSRLIHAIVLASFTLCMCFGMFVHCRGATSEAVWRWNNTGEVLDWHRGTSDHIDWHPERVWDYHDLQFLRGLKR